MDADVKKHYDAQYLKEKKSIQEEIEASERILEANKILRDYNWYFVHPYIQVFKISNILSHHKNGTLSQQTVSDLFIKDFFELDRTVSFIDGHFSHSKYIHPFNYYIEYSLILCFQQDYAGAINLIIPTIEGMLSNYLKATRNIGFGNGGYQNIKSAIQNVLEDLIKQYSTSESKYLNKGQKDFLIKQEKKYLENWFSIITSFLNDCVFADSRLVDSDVLNRHVILHQLKITSYHTIENYIKLFNTIKFIYWIFSKVERTPILNEIETGTFITKRIQYEEVIKKANKLAIHKHAILGSYSLHNRSHYNLFRKFESIYDDLPLKLRLVLKFKKIVDNLKSRTELGKYRINLGK